MKKHVTYGNQMIIFRASISWLRLKAINRFLLFDNFQISGSYLTTDRAAPIWDFWLMFNDNLLTNILIWLLTNNCVRREFARVFSSMIHSNQLNIGKKIYGWRNPRTYCHRLELILQGKQPKCNYWQFFHKTTWYCSRVQSNQRRSRLKASDVRQKLNKVEQQPMVVDLFL